MPDRLDHVAHRNGSERPDRLGMKGVFSHHEEILSLSHAILREAEFACFERNAMSQYGTCGEFLRSDEHSNDPIATVQVVTRNHYDAMRIRVAEVGLVDFTRIHGDQ